MGTQFCGNSGKKAAEFYISKGIAFVPIPSGEKAPTAIGWQNRHFAPDDCPENANIGALLGERSNLVDIDLDDEAARDLAPQYLPPTPAIFGRPGNPKSHYVYHVENPQPTRRFQAEDRSPIAEYRSTGAQTVFPPSIHPSGERIEWIDPENINPANVDGIELLRAVERLVEAVKAKRAGKAGNLGGEFNANQVQPTRELSKLDRYKRYMTPCPDAVSGQDGHGTTLHAFCTLFRLGMSDEEAWEGVLWYNATKCSPPWSEKELRHKLKEGKKKVMEAGEFGKLLNEAAPMQNFPFGGIFQGKSAAPVPAPYSPFPAAVLPSPIRELVLEGAAAIQVDPVQIALPALVACSAAIGNSRTIQLKQSWREPAVIWGAIILPSGARKSPALDLALEPSREMQHKAFMEYRNAMEEYRERKAEWDSQNKKLRGPEPQPPVCPRFVVTDTTIEALVDRLQSTPRGLLCERDELSGWLNSFDQYKKKGGGDVAHWLSMHRAGAVSMDRKDATKTVYVKRGFVSLTGGIQPGILGRALTAENMENGLASRLLMGMPPVIRPVWTEAVVNEWTKKRYAETLTALQAIPMDGDLLDPEPLDIPLDSQAKELWIQFYNAHSAAAPTNSDKAELAAAWSKLEGYAARLALIVHMVRVVNGEANPAAIDAVSMSAGIALANWFGFEAERVYCMLGTRGAAKAEEEVDPAAKLLKVISENGGRIAPATLTHKCRAYRKPGAAKVALQWLVDAGFGKWDGNVFELFPMRERVTILQPSEIITATAA